MMNFPYIDEIEKKIGYSFQDKSLLIQAFTRTSYTNEHDRKGYQSNQVLEFFGDSVLSCALVTLLIRDFSKRYEHGIMTELDEGDFTTLKSKLSDKTKLSSASDTLGLAPYLLMGEGDRKQGVSGEPSVLEDLYEAIIGAIWIDCGGDIDVVSRVVERTLDFRAFVFGGEKKIQSFKNALQEYCQDKSRRLPAPRYVTVAQLGPDHDPTFRVACYVAELVEYGEGKNTKKAENAAAQRMLATLTETGGHSRPPVSEKRHPADTAISRLQRHAAKVGKGVLYSEPEESIDEETGDCLYLVLCTFLDKTTEAIGKSKREAKQESARKMLELLGIL